MNEIEEILLTRRGGMTTMKILDLILSGPYNSNQIANTIELDYSTVIHHTELLLEKGIIMKEEKHNYASIFKPTQLLIKNISIYNRTREILIIRRKKFKQ